MEGTGRLETFADGVFAIAATLLILDVHRTGDGSVASSLVHAWPSYLAYAISFLTIGIIWVNHHTVMKQIDRVDRTFPFLNVVLLMIVASSPSLSVLAIQCDGDELKSAIMTATAVSTRSPRT